VQFATGPNVAPDWNAIQEADISECFMILEYTLKPL
jgi:hypothetical protein